VRFTISGFGAGLAAAIGVPIVVASYSSYGFWNLVRDTGGALGFDSTSVAVHPTIVVLGSVLIVIGLVALVRRLATASEGARGALVAASVVGGTLLGVGGATMLAYGLPTMSPWRAPVELVGEWLVGPGLLLILGVYVVAGVLSLRSRALGPLSFAPLAVASSMVLISVVALIGFLNGQPMQAFLREPAMVLAVWLVPVTSIVLGVALALTPVRATTPRARSAMPQPA
jgi:hypothetical protein